MNRILLAEDNPADVYLIREALNQNGSGYELTVVSDGEEALRAIESAVEPFSLVILDLNMPKVEGSEVLRVIRTKEHLNTTPVVIFTSSGAPADRSSIEGLDATAYIMKPTDLEAFLDIGRTFFGLMNRQMGIGKA